MQEFSCSTAVGKGTKNIIQTPMHHSVCSVATIFFGGVRVPIEFYHQVHSQKQKYYFLLSYSYYFILSQDITQIGIPHVIGTAIRNKNRFFFNGFCVPIAKKNS